MAELEERYTVFKNTDVARLDKKAQDQLHRLAAAHNFVRELRGVGPLEGLFVEKDWPEYKRTKRNILLRADEQRLPIGEFIFLLGMVLLGLYVGTLIG
jgi:hypothetical protein